MEISRIFDEFIQVVKGNADYVIGLLDDKNKIIDCSNRDFVERQISLVTGDNSSDFFYPLQVEKKKFGVLWVQSMESSAQMVGNLLAQSLENRIAYELKNESVRLNTSLDDRLIKLFITEEEFDFDLALSLMEDLKMKADISRVAIFITKDNDFDTDDITRLKYRTESKGSIQSLLNRNSLLLLKDLPEKIHLADRKIYFMSFIHELQEWGLTDCCFFIGSVQEEIPNYYKSFHDCLWLKNNVDFEENLPVYFSDYQFDYLVSQLSSSSNEVLSNILEAYKAQTQNEKIDINELIKVANCLFCNDFNITQTANALFLHKNTLIYKLKKYEDILGLDLHKNFHDKIIFYLLAMSFDSSQKRKQEGAEIYEF